VDFHGVSRRRGTQVSYTAIADALAGLGFQPEARPHTPRVTLAWCDPGSANDIIDRFLKQHADFSLTCGMVDEFGLYSSEFIDGVPVYRRQQTFALQAAADNVDG
jgi:2'-5' RNA ligase